VDDKDPKWREEYTKYALLETGEKRECRYRDWENLHYWFRGVEKFAPWVDKIFFLTANQIPQWMNVDHPKLRIVNHEEYIPKELLPTFNSNTIELFMHQIPDLSEQFVLFNDDFFIINNILPKRFFRKGLPVDICAMNVYHGGELSSNCMCNLEVINKHFNKRQVIKKNFFKWFSLFNGKNLIRTFLLVGWPQFVGFYEPHLPQPFLKSILKEVWAKESKAIIDSIRPHFRQKTNLTQYLYRYWQLVTGNFVCRNICSDSAVLQIEEENMDEIVEIITKQKKNIIVLNDSEDINFEKNKNKINQAFHSILSEKSSFEK
jgi:hypothetical protein